ncbi:protein HEXIM1 [Aricia agestis]|uniref:protein HEXIM1 n=1 Tax=Aricia agestis TaxID=91739 RepID=UPI001C20672A|nr:protein HEXIM1 [Aricia agestis]
MEINNAGVKDGDATQSLVLLETPSIIEMPKLQAEKNIRKKRRRGKTKRKIVKPFIKIPWQDRRNYDNSKRKNNRFRKIVLSKTQAPFNNNQFLMEIHKPEPETGIHTFRTPSARTRDSSFSVDSEENYFFSLPEDEEEFLTKEFSSVYEDAQCERLSDMSKNELIQEYLLLEAKYDNLIRRSERVKCKDNDENKEMIDSDKDISLTDGDSMSTDKDNSGTSLLCCPSNEPNTSDILQRLKEQEEQIRELQIANEKLTIENNKLRQRPHRSSEDSESDSSSSSDSCSTSSCSMSPPRVSEIVNGDVTVNGVVQVNGVAHDDSPEPTYPPLVNGFHSPKD